MKGVLDTFEFLKKNGVDDFSFYRVVENFTEIKSFVDEIEFPCFLKVDLSEHKTELNAVRRCRNFLELKENFDSLRKSFPENKIILQKEGNGLELFIGIKKDPAFGNVLGIGFGGTNVEVYDDVTFRVLPFDKTEIFEMINELKFKYVFHKRKKYDLDAFIKLILKISKFGDKFSFLDLNPVILNEQGCFILDARGEWSE